MLFGLTYWVEGYPVIGHDDPRSAALFASWAGRLAAAADDLNLDLLVA